VHRDLKPENIFLAETTNGVHPKVLDFGISKILDASGNATVTTTQGHVVGTPAYMSPEQARGIKLIDKRTDVYSMGVVLYELLSGEMPFFSENPGDLLIMIITEEPEPLIELLPDVGAEVSAIVERAMSKDPDARFADAPELQRALLAAADRLLGTEASRRLGERRRPVSWRKRATTRGQADSDALTIVGPTMTTPPRAVRSPIPRKRTQPNRLRGYAIAAAAAFAAGAIGGAAIWLGRSSANSASPRVIVVRADPVESNEPITAPFVAGTEALPSEAAPGPEPAPSEPQRKALKPHSSAPRDTASELAESFRRQKANVVLCVNEHADVVELTPKLGVRFTVSADGSVVQAEVAPAGVATTPLGTCIRKAAQGMRFPRQAAAISFEVPLTAKKGT
jgi:serine/threonine protein kinase